MSSFVFRFTHAITRKPSRSIANGLRAEDCGNPDPNLFMEHHEEYVRALTTAGAQVITLDPLEEFPDSVFVEDTALCLPEGAIVMRPGAPSRLGEAAAIKPTLLSQFSTVMEIENGFIEGGDILVTGEEILVGTSDRTNEEGIAELAGLVKQWGYKVRRVQTPPEVLHFKTDCGLLDAKTILATERLASSGCFNDYKVILTAKGEEAAANAVRFNDVVLLPAGFSQTASRLKQEGYTVVELPNSEAAKVDGGMSCLSLRYCATL
ncbi:dimethylarginine dimethylaminohydrolase family protein [Sneathiella glossodoripedis]|uniref:dimethylarginine dimethylaminohydrolase family protein n=1 Tax=Sneathiella glossodoripedis TaxID=418853 RepID=UPI000472DE5E|nr:arginine deiminase family protein [Sneathiella glossodoripedis]